MKISKAVMQIIEIKWPAGLARKVQPRKPHFGFFGFDHHQKPIAKAHLEQSAVFASQKDLNYEFILKKLLILSQYACRHGIELVEFTIKLFFYMKK